MKISPIAKISIAVVALILAAVAGYIFRHNFGSPGVGSGISQEALWRTLGIAFVGIIYLAYRVNTLKQKKHASEK